MGIEWPTNNSTQKSSTTSTAKQVWVACLKALADGEGIDDVLVTRAQTLRQKLVEVPNAHWRHGYIPFLVEVGELMALAPPEVTIAMAKDGLQALNTSMMFGDTNAHEAVFNYSAMEDKFETLTLKGDATPLKSYELIAQRRTPLEEPRILVRNDMVSQLEAWATYGCMEPECATSASEIAVSNDLSSFVNDKVFVLLGATSALGPVEVLSKLPGATIAAVARPGQKLRSLQRKWKEGLLADSATVLLPSKGGIVGADLMTDTPALARWICDLELDKQLVICCLAYLDGEKNVRASVGMDLICEYVCSKRSNTALSYIVSPATAHLAPKCAIEDSVKRRAKGSLWQRALTFVPFIGLTNPNVIPLKDKDPDYFLFNGLADIQGPNYALAKTSQQWRAMVAYWEGHAVSANHGPPSRTENMVSHSMIRDALEGQQSFAPLIAFDPKPANTLMTALLLHDLKNSGKAKRHPMTLFVENAVHGGLWRCPYDVTSVGPYSVLLGKFKAEGESPVGTTVDT